MKADAELRMNVYQEGQRAFNARTPCPYTDWRAKTWEKGRAAAQAHSESFLYEPEPPKLTAADIARNEVLEEVATHLESAAYWDCTMDASACASAVRMMKRDA